MAISVILICHSSQTRWVFMCAVTFFECVCACVCMHACMCVIACDSCHSRGCRVVVVHRDAGEVHFGTSHEEGAEECDTGAV